MWKLHLSDFSYIHQSEPNFFWIWLIYVHVYICTIMDLRKTNSLTYWDGFFSFFLFFEKNSLSWGTERNMKITVIIQYIISSHFGNLKGINWFLFHDIFSLVLRKKFRIRGNLIKLSNNSQKEREKTALKFEWSILQLLNM
jgi:hypothetical protein